MGSINARLQKLESAVKPTPPANPPDDWHAEFVRIVRNELGKIGNRTPHENLALAEAAARQWKTDFHVRMVEENRRTLELWQTLHTLTADNATDLYNLILVCYAERAVPMLSIFVQIACNKLRLFDTPSGQFEDWRSEFSPRMFEHLPERTHEKDIAQTGESEN